MAKKRNCVCVCVSTCDVLTNLSFTYENGRKCNLIYLFITIVIIIIIFCKRLCFYARRCHTNKKKKIRDELNKKRRRKSRKKTHTHTHTHTHIHKKKKKITCHTARFHSEKKATRGISRFLQLHRRKKQCSFFFFSV